MKKIIFTLTIALLCLTSCKDYLDRPTLTSYDESNFWRNENTVRMYAQGAYIAYFKGYGSGFDYGNWCAGYVTWADEDIRTTAWATQTQTTTSGSGWSFSWVRRHNLMLDRVSNSATLSDEAKNHWTGIARFFRALEYADLCATFGDMPYYDHEIFDGNPEELFKDRDPIGFCVTKIIEDFDYAAANVRQNDGVAQINRDVVLAYMVKRLLYFGTLLKYHNLDQTVSTAAFNKAKWAAEELINGGRYQISDDYRGLFTTLNTLRNNPEVIFYREYATSLANHAMLTVSYIDGQAGTTLRTINNYLSTDGLPIKQSPLYAYSPSKDYTEMVKNRDPRLLASFADTLRVPSVTGGGIGYSTTGIATVKFQPVNATIDNIIYQNRNNITACPLMRYGEVLVAYAEVMAELGQFTQAVADASINKLRNRSIPHNGATLPKLPPMVVSGSDITANSVVLNDPDRDPSVSPILWEIRRERMAELVFEGQRKSDLKRWKKYSYLRTMETDGRPSDIAMGAPFSLYRWGTTGYNQLHIQYPNAGQFYVFSPGDSTSIAIYNLYQAAGRRDWVEGDIIYERQYFTSLPTEEITFYKDRGHKLTQNPGWSDQ
ncbi:MAG: RagB/SusD family nutrient uptake outer membrane protein [Bacteroidetes bacterium]|nr:RagB/SusD family nutrient uptake outer membrane protein [Bacteroidota bacterium]